MIRVLIFIMGMLPVCLLYAQENIPVGTWRTHFSYNNTQHVATAGARIYASSENGLYFFDKDDNSITKISKIEGLQGEDVSSLYYDEGHDQVLIGYHSGNIDVIRDQEIINFDLVTASQIAGAKGINHIVQHESFAYISTDYGVLKFDLNKLEVKESYRELGQGGQPLNIRQGAVMNDSLFLATEEGVIAGNLSGNVNLLDYENWKRYDADDSIPAEPVAIIIRLQNKIVAGINDKGLYAYNGGEWTHPDLLGSAEFRSAQSVGQEAFIVHDNGISRVSAAFEVEAITGSLVSAPNEVTEDDEGNLWIADGSHGLLSDYQEAFLSYTPIGPYRHQVFRLVSYKTDIYALPGGYTSGVSPEGNTSGFYRYYQGEWLNYNMEGVNIKIPEFKDVVDAAYSEHFNSLFVASAGYGVLQIAADGTMDVIDETSGSPLQNLSSTERQVLIPAIVADAEGLWILNYGVDSPLHLLQKDGTWNSYNIDLPKARYPLDIMIVGDYVWMIIDPAHGGGIVVFDPASGRERYLTEVTDNGSLADVKVNAFTSDRDGLVWVGTNAGVSVFTSPHTVVEGPVNAIEPVLEGGTLLSDEKVTAIKVDGGNRKWVGTTHGVWLFTDDAGEQLAYLNSSNSPLPHDEILDIEIDPKSGEVFFATKSGIVSFRGTATSSEPFHADVKIFPNPIRADFKGIVGISGLATDAFIKITDVSGKLIWQTQANGGTATWNVTNHSGSRAATGVYLVFSASEDGKETFVGKIAVVN